MQEHLKKCAAAIQEFAFALYLIQGKTPITINQLMERMSTDQQSEEQVEEFRDPKFLRFMLLYMKRWRQSDMPSGTTEAVWIPTYEPTDHKDYQAMNLDF